MPCTATAETPSTGSNSGGSGPVRSARVPQSAPTGTLGKRGTTCKSASCGSLLGSIQALPCSGPFSQQLLFPSQAQGSRINRHHIPARKQSRFEREEKMIVVGRVEIIMFVIRSSHYFRSVSWPPSKIAAGIFTRKLPYGQGGKCDLSLLNRNYQIQFETIWEDHCELEVEGVFESDVTIFEEQGVAVLRDTALSPSSESVNIKFRMPEDYTFNGRVNGSISHLKSKVSNKLRSNETEIELLGEGRVFQWGALDCPFYSIKNPQGTIDIQQSTFQKATFDCLSFTGQKLLFAQQLNLRAEHSIVCRSVVTYGEAIARLSTKYLQLESISGHMEIQCGEKVKIDRLWGSPNGINVKCKQIDRIGVETGSGFIEVSEGEIDISKISLGKLHRGKLEQVSRQRVEILV